jgi:hypothetical protein
MTDESLDRVRLAGDERARELGFVLRVHASIVTCFGGAAGVAARRSGSPQRRGDAEKRRQSKKGV